MFLLIAGGAATLCYRTPVYNWDLLGYVATVLSLQDDRADRIHEQTLAAIRSGVPPEARAQFIDSPMPYRQQIAANPDYLYQLLPYYRFRPLYIGALALLESAGVHPVRATLLVATLSYVVLAIFVFIWIGRYVSPPLALLLSTALVLSRPLLQLGRLSTPDAMSAAVLVAALFFLVHRRNLPVFMPLAAASIFVRPNNVLLVGLLLSCVWLRGLAPISRRLVTAAETPPERRGPDALQIRLAGLLGGLAVFAASYLLISWWAGHYGWKTWFYHTFVEKVYTPAAVEPVLTLGAYSTQVVRHGLSSLRDSSFFLFALLGMLAAWLATRSEPSRAPDLAVRGETSGQATPAIHGETATGLARRSRDRGQAVRARKPSGRSPATDLLAVAALSVLGQFLLFPVILDRLFVPHYVLVTVLLIQQVSVSTRGVEEANRP